MNRWTIIFPFRSFFPIWAFHVFHECKKRHKTRHARWYGISCTCHEWPTNYHSVSTPISLLQHQIVSCDCLHTASGSNVPTIIRRSMKSNRLVAPFFHQLIDHTIGGSLNRPRATCVHWTLFSPPKAKQTILINWISLDRNPTLPSIETEAQPNPIQLGRLSLVVRSNYRYVTGMPSRKARFQNVVKIHINAF